MKNPTESLLLSRSTELVADRLPGHRKFYCAERVFRSLLVWMGPALMTGPLSVPDLSFPVPNLHLRRGLLDGRCMALIRGLGLDLVPRLEGAVQLRGFVDM
jgi:hypothetical protein